jgi:hypothetical protein
VTYPGPTVSEYLKAPALFAAVDETGEPVQWAELGLESETISPLFDPEDADDEAVRQFAFMRGPLVEDVATVAGRRRDLMLCVITLSGAATGPALVIGYRELDAETELSVIRSLAA